ncbi:HupE/UreJ family protein [Klebsiella pneumoniae]|uniref:HupE/UreJ family protein n=1 Tax=Klebsiella pneumoniae TaxID=573 RepID=A0A927E1H8_KLEPN|nr:HupE/UreJ family protein [Klebsiella pneumoniae]
MHGVAEGDKGYIQEITGVNIIPFIYLGAKHMVTGYDHLLFLFGVIFLSLQKCVISGCTLACSLSGIQRRCSSAPSLISASVLTLLTPLSGCPWSIKRLITSGHSSAGLAFSPTRSLRRSSLDFFHGFGLATKIQEFEISPDGLFVNLIAFNIGVEIGQLLALSAILIVMSYWRQTASFFRHAYTANVVMMSAGFLLMSYQLCGYILA